MPPQVHWPPRAASSTIIGFIFLADITAIGGGTMRDLVLASPVFWVVQPLYLFVGTLAAIAVYFTAHKVESRYRTLLWLDAIGHGRLHGHGRRQGSLRWASARQSLSSQAFSPPRSAAYCATWWWGNRPC